MEACGHTHQTSSLQHLSESRSTRHQSLFHYSHYTHIQNFFEAIFKVEDITHPDELRVPRRAPNFQFSYGIEKTGFRAYYTADAKND